MVVLFIYIFNQLNNYLIWAAYCFRSQSVTYLSTPLQRQSLSWGSSHSIKGILAEFYGALCIVSLASSHSIMGMLA
jgi:hypothetical protein